MSNHWKLCLLIAVVGFAAIFIFKVPFSNILTFGVLLACPLMHFFMMKNMHCEKPSEKSQEKPPEKV